MNRYYLIDFQCPKCKKWDEEVEISEKEYEEAMQNNGWLHHTCSYCRCEFKQQE